MARSDEYQKWSYITLSDFSSSSCGTVFSYIWLWTLAIIGIAVYGVDTYTAVNLLAFDRWSSTFQPIVPLKYSKWIFTGCILLSWTLLAYEWIRAWRVIKRQNVAESYLDPLALNFQSMRMGKNGQGWRRFLVFKELTKSKKGADYCALFCYYNFKEAVRVLLAVTPRQAINGLTLYSVMRASLVPIGAHAASDGSSPFVQFWKNVGIMWEASPRQAIVLGGMLFTFFIWIFSALSLIIACIIYIGFLWHYLPKITLNRYCRKKVDKRLARIVNVKTKAALERDDMKRARDEEKAGPRPPGHPGLSRTATLPMLDDSSMYQPTLHHSNSISSSVTGSSERKPTLPDLGDVNEKPGFERNTSIKSHQLRPGMPTRSDTLNSDVSVSSVGSERPLLQSANSFDQTVSPIEHQPLPNRINPYPGRKPLPVRSMTGDSQDSFRSGPPQLSRSQTAQSLNDTYRTASPNNGPAYEMQRPPMARRPIPAPYQGQRPSQPPQVSQQPNAAPAAYAPFRPPVHPSYNPQGQPQPTRSYSVATGGPSPSHSMDRATPPPRVGTAPPLSGQGYRRPPPEPLSRGYASTAQPQQGGRLPWQSPPPQ